MYARLITRLNLLLAPLSTFILQKRKYIGGFFLLLAFLSLIYLFDANSIKDSGGVAILILWIILWIPIFSRVFGLKIAQVIMPLRKELGILMGTLAFVHGARYFLSNPDQIGTSGFWLQDGFLSYLAFGFFALLFTLPLLFTSSNWMMRKMGKYWKYLHRTVYLVVIFAVVHVVLLKLFIHLEVAPMIMLAVYFFFKVLEWRGFSFAKKIIQKIYPKGQKWLCVPCGYIYDPAHGDADSGIRAGTEFTDIPDSWVCPVCGVRKSDFIIYTEGSSDEPYHEAKIVTKTFLNPTTLELIIETDTAIKSQPGQFMVFLWKDALGDFARQYSIVEQSGNRYTFTIKLSDRGRGSRLLHEISVGTSIRIRGIYGNFLLQDHQSPKIFIATGTGLAPIYNMIRSLVLSSERISLYFSVSTKGELLYVDKLLALPHIDLHIHVTRERVEGFEQGRVDVDMIQASPETEWYLCGNPRMVTEAKGKLAKRGFERVYSEEF